MPGALGSLPGAVQYGLSLREAKRRFDLDQAAQEKERQMQEAARARLENRQKAEQFFETLDPLQRMFPGTAAEEMEMLQGSRAAGDELVGTPGDVTLRKEALKKYAAALRKRELETAALARAKARGNASGLSYAERGNLERIKGDVRTAGAAAAWRPAPGLYFDVDESGQPKVTGYESLYGGMGRRAEEARGAIRDLGPLYGLPNYGPPDVTQGNMSPVVPPTRPAPAGPAPAAPVRRAAPGPRVAKIHVRDIETGQTGWIDPAEFDPQVYERILRR